LARAARTLTTAIHSGGRRQHPPASPRPRG